MLRVRNLVARYGDFQALFGVDFDAAKGQIVALIGANGAGKSTFLRSIAGLMPSKGGEIRFQNEDIGALAADEVVRRGVSMVPEGRRLFRSLTVEENLRAGAFAGRAGRWRLETVFALFPVLRERRANPATALSGGQQQMVAIGRALMSNPDLLLCDELSLGLSPAVVKDIYAVLPKIRDEGVSIVVVEQDIDMALKAADEIYCFMHGRVTLRGAPRDLGREAISAAYFGLEDR
ncbi:amino acid/amide ABC transporter ATP-binding protein 2 (HAAT family) [Roseiarcus fermentans]|uniref:Amino acid/amide ABC transporter ATP-binding protein 2 (HAAT family) n=1 Tax=Roseiarcus fermentans TaxID=1473586 RepID=A0A366EMD1_9HYPH|nr:ABC transporter ATP-binding protein [Roseiarcus fermentans]RBP02870.1 amino acid/amide ABC transporter ATP-binding protein 2 (HAAT family) [Roseiarcus fermentans]